MEAMWERLQIFFADFGAKFHLNFIAEERWKLLVNGLGTTLLIAFFAVILGLIIGFMIAIIRSVHESTGRFKVLNAFSKLYLTVIRGTPVVIQLLIIHFVIFSSLGIPKMLTAILAFGINSGAYVAEIVRSGIMSIDGGQTEAGRSLGLSYAKTMRSILLPQAVKNILPALANEFIVLLKETSIAGYIAIQDLTKGADIIRSRTFDAFMPLIAAALIYLGLVMFLSAGVTRLERMLRKSDNR